jgi:hypothetical protein
MAVESTGGAEFRSLVFEVDGPFRQDIIGMTAEEDRVAVEVEGEGRLRDGVVYRMNYHFLLVSVMDSSTRSKNTVTPQ